MGKGDRRTRRGKIFRGSYGKTRPRKRKKRNKAKLNKSEPPVSGGFFFNHSNF